jgi:fucose 4-O-acetylase-like acetyltransferase
MLFIISGYIFTLQDYKPYVERIQKRFKTLIIPFIIWSAVGLLITFLWQQHPLTAQAVYDAQLDQLGDNRPYSQMNLQEIMQRWLYRPASFQLWFIRSLFIYNMLYPLFKWLVTKATVIWFIVAFIGWFTISNFLFLEGQGVFFFTLGIWLNKKEFNLEKKPKWFSTFLSWLFFIGVSVIKTFMAFELEADNPETIYILNTLHIVTVSSGIVAVWFGADDLVKWFMHKKWFVWFISFSFILYALHVPLLHYTRIVFSVRSSGFILLYALHCCCLCMDII